jgi:hypothetical protein
MPIEESRNMSASMAYTKTALSAKSQNTQFRKRRTSAPTHGNGPDEEIIRRAADGFTVDGG